MTKNWNFGEQIPIEGKSRFTKDADAAFDEFCRRYLNSSNGFFMNIDNQTTAKEEAKISISETPNRRNSIQKSNLQNNTNHDSIPNKQFNVVNGFKSARLNNNNNQSVLNSISNINSMENGNRKPIEIKNGRNSLKSNIYLNSNTGQEVKISLGPKKSRNSENFQILKKQQETFDSLLNSLKEIKQEFKNKKVDSIPTEPKKVNYYKYNHADNYYIYDNSNDIFLDSNKSSLFSDEQFDLSTSSVPLEIPKKNKFSDEFFLKQPKNNKENESHLENIQPYIVNSLSPAQKPDGWLGFKVVACGMNKKAQLPIPKANFFIEKGDFGDDAGFWSENSFGDAIGIADGATGNSMFGYDPGDFSRNLMKLCSEIFVSENKMSDAKTLLLKAYDTVQDKTCYGSCTACVLTLDHSNKMMTIANVGDSGYCLFRNGKILHQSVPQRITFECPRQLDSYPWKEASRRMGVSYTDIIGKDTELELIEVMKDDMVIISSDGLFDNLDPYEIEEICQKSKSVMDAAENLVYRSVKYYRKPDDILVIIAKVVDNKISTIQQKYSKDPST